HSFLNQSIGNFPIHVLVNVQYYVQLRTFHHITLDDQKGTQLILPHNETSYFECSEIKNDQYLRLYRHKLTEPHLRSSSNYLDPLNTIHKSFLKLNLLPYQPKLNLHIYHYLGDGQF